MNSIPEKIYRGNRWSHQIELPAMPTGFDWSTVGVSCQLRASREPLTPVLFVFTPRITVDGEGKTFALLDLPGYVTASAPKQVAADVHLYRGSPLFGPYTVAQFDLFILPTT